MPFLQTTWRSMRRLALPALYVGALVLSFIIYHDNSPRFSDHPSFVSGFSKDTDHENTPLPAPLPSSWDSVLHLAGPPSTKFRDNLLPGKSYVTTWIDAGFTNEFMTYVNLIYLATMSERIPIVPPFAPFHHMRQSAGILAFGDVFDLADLRKTLRNPVLEWREVKHLPPPGSSNRSDDEEIGCWSSWATAGRPGENSPRQSTYLVQYLGLDPSYIPTPRGTRRRLDNAGAWDPQLYVWSLVALIFPSTPPTAEPAVFPSPKGHRNPPDTHLACFDFLYFIAAGKADMEWDEDYAPAWRYIGRHLKWTQPIINLAKEYLARALKVASPELIPPVITVHVRRGDFGDNCWQAANADECFAPISAYARRVKEVQDQLYAEQNIEIPNKHVILTSDEESPEFWAEVAAQGWQTIDRKQERILETHGEWYATLIDMVVQSFGKGFVGTDQSTVSIVARRRVLDWNAGVVRTVRWGKLGADDH